MKTTQYEFCSKCGGQVFALPDQAEDISPWQQILHCDTCDSDCTLGQVVAMVIRSDSNGRVWHRYLLGLDNVTQQKG